MCFRDFQESCSVLTAIGVPRRFFKEDKLDRERSGTDIPRSAALIIWRCPAQRSESFPAWALLETDVSILEAIHATHVKIFIYVGCLRSVEKSCRDEKFVARYARKLRHRFFSLALSCTSNVSY